VSIADSLFIGYNAFVKTYPIWLIGSERRQAVVVSGGDVAARKAGGLAGLVSIIKAKGIEETKVRVWQLLTEDSK